MSNTLGTLSGTLILQEALALTFRERPELRMLSMGFRDLDGRASAAVLNQAVTSRIFSVATVNDFGTGATNRGDTDVTCTLTGQKEIHHAFTPSEYNATDRDLIRESARPIAVALANHIVDSVRDLWVETNFPNTDTFHQVTVASGWSYTNTLRPIRKNLNKAGVPKGARFAAFNSDVYDALLGDTTVVAALNNPDNQGAIKSGRLPDVAGLGLAEYPDLSVNVGESIAIASANTTTDVITCSAAHGLVTGQRIHLTVSSGLTGLTTDTSYYVIKVAATTLKLATSAANASAGTAIDIPADGTGSMVDARLGFAGTPDSTIYLARAMRNPAELAPNLAFPGVIGYVQDPVTGFQVLVNQWIDPSTLNVNNRICWLEGYAKGNANNGLLLYKN
jgi:hypothetical protein